MFMNMACNPGVMFFHVFASRTVTRIQIYMYKISYRIITPCFLSKGEVLGGPNNFYWISCFNQGTANPHVASSYCVSLLEFMLF